jgi:hypothetical protein
MTSIAEGNRQLREDRVCCLRRYFHSFTIMTIVDKSIAFVS